MNVTHLAAAGIILIVACMGCATPMGGAADIPDMQPGQRPDSTSTEAGLWMKLDNIERDIQTSGTRIRDPGLNRYIGDIVCRLSGDFCPDIRVYVLNIPNFNASMAPNGMMNVWSGLILRSQNEAQLAAVLGHEIGHYVRRHSLKRFKDMSAKMDLLAMFSLGMAAAGGGNARAAIDIATLVTIASIAPPPARYTCRRASSAPAGSRRSGVRTACAPSRTPPRDRGPPVRDRWRSRRASPAPRRARASSS